MAGTSPAMTRTIDRHVTKTNARHEAGHSLASRYPLFRSSPRKRGPSREPALDSRLRGNERKKSLLLRRLGRRGRRRDRVVLLDLGIGAQLGDEIGLRLARHVLLDLRLDLVEARRRLLALVLDL